MYIIVYRSTVNLVHFFFFSSRRRHTRWPRDWSQTCALPIFQIDLPLGWQVSSLPQPVTQDAKLIVYNSKADNKNGTLHLERHLTVELALLEQKYYPTLRNFYQLVKNADEQQIVLQPLGAASGN